MTTKTRRSVSTGDERSYEEQAAIDRALRATDPRATEAKHRPRFRLQEDERAPVELDEFVDPDDVYPRRGRRRG